MQIDGVSEVKIEPAETPERLAVTVESRADGDIRSAIAKRIIGEGFDLYELRAIRLTLEDIFLQLTTEEPPAVPEVAAAEVAV
jgi:ABC-2 type transport system ATP-binding protein